MLLDEVRMMAKRKKEMIDNDPDVKEEDKKFSDTLVKLFNNRDAIVEAPKSLILGSLMFVGYDYKDLEKVYNKLMNELTRTYKIISLEA